MTTRFIKALYTATLLIILLTGCGGTDQEGLSNVQINPTQPQIQTASTEEFPLPNCGGSGEIVQTLKTQASVTYKIEISDKYTVRAGGEGGAPVEILGLPVGLKLKLEGEIEHAYKSDFEAASSRLDEYVLRAAPQSSVVYVIQWNEQKYSSTISFDSGGKRYDVPFIYTIHVPKLSDSYKKDCPQSSFTSTTNDSSGNSSNINPDSSTTTNVVCGQAVSPEALANCIGGNASYWTYRGPDVWGYWNKGHNVTFHHPGGGTIITYWAGFPDPRNAQGCQIIIVKAEDTKYIKCAQAGAEFEADGVGFHLVDHTSVFK